MSASYKPGDTVWVEFCTSVFSTGAAGNPTGTPVGTLNRNGTDDGAVTVTVSAPIDTGRQTATFVIPATYVAGDELNLSISATVSGVAGKGVVWRTRLGIGVIRSSTATAGANGSITLDASASTTLDFYRGCWIVLLGGTGAGQARFITTSSTARVASVAPNWITNPDNTTVFAIIAAAAIDNAPWNVITGTCTSNGTTTTIIDTSLSAYASLTGRVVIWRTGANIGSQVQITAHTAGGTTLTVALMGNASSSGDVYEIF